MRKALAGSFLLGLVVVLAARAEDADPKSNWPQWRGPLATGEGPQADPPLRWDEKTNVKWKTAIPGKGSATPAVWGNRIFVLTAQDTGRKAAPTDIPKLDSKLEKKTQAPDTYWQFLVLCLDRQTGKILWQKTAAEKVPHEGMHPSHSYAASSPITDGKYVYAPFGSFGFYCFDLLGNKVWERQLGLMQTRLGWGEGATPALHGDTLVVNWDHEAGSYITALDAKTGKTRWKVDRDEVSTWTTPLIVDGPKGAQAIVPATNRVRSYDLATGKVLWECGGQTINVIPSAVQFGKTVICMSGYRGAAAAALPVDAAGDITKSDKILWTYDKGTPYVPSPLLMGGRLYFVQRNEPVLTVLDAATGKPLVDRARLPTLTSLYASPSGAKDRVYFVGREGATLVLKAGDKLDVLATNRLDEPIDASPVLVGRQLLLRGERHLYCIEER